MKSKILFKKINSLWLILSLLFFTTVVSFSAFANTVSCRVLLQALDNKRYALTVESLHPFASQLFLDAKTVNNEKKSYLFKAHSQKGQALLGLGGDINYNLAVTSNHKALYIYDMDPRVIGFHHLVKIAIQKSKSPVEFIHYFSQLQNKNISDSQKKQFLQDIQNELHDSNLAEQLFTLAIQSDLKTHFTQTAQALNEQQQPYTYLANQNNYNLLRDLFLKKQVHFYLGSHFDLDLMTEIANDIRQTRLSLNRIYTSNSLEPRWVIDRKDPMAQLLLMMSASASNDRGSILLFKEKVENELRNIEQTISLQKPLSESDRFLLQQKLQRLNAQLAEFSQKASFYDLGEQNWLQLTKAFQQLPTTAETEFLVTSLEPFYTLGLNKDQYQILGTEGYNTTENSRIEWTYAQTTQSHFIGLMPQATVKRSEEIYTFHRLTAQRIQEILRRLN